MKKMLVVAAILIFTIGCHKAPTIKKAITPEVVMTHKYKLSPFKSIVLDGNTTIKLVNGSYAANNNLITVTNQVLRVAAAPPSANNLTIKVFSPGLKNITVTGNAVVNAKDFKSAGLTVTAKDNGTINLEGRYNIDKIYQGGKGRINISWIDSDNLFVDSNSSGPICLSGVVNSMVARLTHNAYFDARYLRVQKVSVFTTDKARADVLAINTLGAFAVDNSNIFYYKKPRNLTVVTNNSGNVLQPDWIH